jgi:hypothetical protein
MQRLCWPVLRVTVCDDVSSEAVPNASLVVTALDGYAISGASTNEIGVATIVDLPAGQVALDIAHEDYQSGYRTMLGLEGGAETTYAARLVRGSSIFGIVREQRTAVPVCDARISQNWSFSKAARSDAHGCYALKGLAMSQQHQIFVDAPGYAGQVVEVSLVKERQQVDIVLAPASRVRGRVVNGAGMAIDNAQIVIRPDDSTPGPLRFAFSSNTHSTASGRFELERLAAGKAIVSAGKYGFAQASWNLPETGSSGEVTDIGVLVLEEEGAILGVTSTKQGDALNNVLLWLDERPENGGKSPLQHAWRIRSTRSNFAGRFVFAGLASGRYTIHAEIPGQVKQEAEVSVMQHEVARITIGLDTGAQIRGFVHTADGVGCDSGVTVYSCPDRKYATKDEERRATRAGQVREDGSFLIVGLEAVPQVLRVVVATGRAGLKMWLDGEMRGVLPDGPAPTIVLQRAVYVSGRVVGEGVDQDATDGAYLVEVMAIEQSVDSTERPMGRAMTDKAGRFRVTAPAEGQFIIRYRREGAGAGTAEAQHPWKATGPLSVASDGITLYAR